MTTRMGQPEHILQQPVIQYQNNFGIPGLSFAGQGAPENPILLVIAAAKVGKTTLALSLNDWPNVGDRPLVLAFDKVGFDSLAQFAPVAGLKVKDQPGLSIWDKTETALQSLENAFLHSKVKTPFSTIVVDCASTMIDLFLQDAMKKDFKDPRQAWGEVFKQANKVMWRLMDLNKPLVFLSWLKEGYAEVTGSGPAKRTTYKLGGAQIDGGFRAKISGVATQILYLDKVKQGANAPGVGADGYVRVLHTRTYNNVEAGGRLTQYLPEPCSPNLAYVFNCITKREVIQSGPGSTAP